MNAPLGHHKESTMVVQITYQKELEERQKGAKKMRKVKFQELLLGSLKSVHLKSTQASEVEE